MYKEIRETYKNLSRDQRNEVLLWASEKFNLSPASVKNNWMYLGSVPKNHQEEVMNKLKSF